MYLFQGKILFGYCNSVTLCVQEEFLTFQLGYINRKKVIVPNFSDIHTRLKSYYCCYYQPNFHKVNCI